VGGEKEEHEVKKADGMGVRMLQPLDSLERIILLRGKEKQVTRTKSVDIALAMLITMVLTSTALAQTPKNEKHWVSAWSSAVHAPLSFVPGQAISGLENRTLRMIVRPTIAGERVRIRFSNACGNQPLLIGAAHIALASKDGKIIVASDRALTFSGKGSTRIPPGAPMLSDPVDLTFPAFAEIAVSIFLAGKVDTTTFHLAGQKPTYLSEPGDFTATAEIPNATTKPSWFFLSGLEVFAPSQTMTILALGDSITDGVGAKQGDYNDWPDLLANRLAAQKGLPAMAVVNTGIGGNRVLHDGAGVSALARFDRDVLAQPGIANIVLLEGINDIGWPRMKPPSPRPGDPAQGAASMESPFARELVSAQDIVAGYQQIIDRAHQHGIKVFIATLLPYEGADYYTEDGEAIRAAVNQWIRTSGASDGYFDFDKAVRDPSHPTRFRDGYHSGDNLHPSTIGYKAMADAVDLALLRGIKLAKAVKTVKETKK
jgi:lysophospholipase L1-like esterase